MTKELQENAQLQKIVEEKKKDLLVTFKNQFKDISKYKTYYEYWS